MKLTVFSHHSRIIDFLVAPSVRSISLIFIRVSAYSLISGASSSSSFFLMLAQKTQRDVLRWSLLRCSLIY